MAVQGITFSKQAVSSNDDAHIYKILLNGRKGKTKGCKMTFGTDDIYVSSGYFWAANRLISIPSTETVSTPVITSGTAYCRLVFEIDLNKVNTNAEFNQGYFKVLSSTTDYPSITQSDLDNGGNVYQLPFAKFIKSVSGISAFVSELESIGFMNDSDTIYVSTSGNDASGDGSESSPYKSIQKAIDSIPRKLENRTITINIASGTYSEDVTISGFSGAPLRINTGTITVNSLSTFDSCIIIEGTGLTIAANGKTYGLHVHRGAALICQIPITVNGASYGVYVGYGSRFIGRDTVTVNSCTYAVTSTFAAHVSISTLTGARNNNGIQASGGIAAVGTIVTSMASTVYLTSSGGRIYTGAQASAPNY